MPRKCGNCKHFVAIGRLKEKDRRAVLRWLLDHNVADSAEKYGMCMRNRKNKIVVKIDNICPFWERREEW